MENKYVAYSADVESFLEDESGIIGDIIASMHRLSERTREQYGHNVRVSHAKSHGVAVGKLMVADNLPEYLAQGLFSKPGTYPVIVRLANVPGEVLPDAVNTQRGFAFKILGVDGQMITENEGGHTQDFILDTGKYFPLPDAKAFLMQHRMIEHAPQMPTVIKEGVSAIARVTNQALNAIGADSGKLDFFGDSRIHPLAEAYYSQAPFRYGNYIAKMAVVPVSAAQKALADADVLVDSYSDKNALRTATVNYLKANDADFEIRIQLCTDLEKMPVEDAKKEWDENVSPYITVAAIHVPRQDAYSEARRKYVDGLSFSIAHCLDAFRPLGSIMRARLQAYPMMAKVRRGGNHEPMNEPVSINEIPA